MPGKRGAPFGERNGRYKTGRYSRTKRAERRVKLHAEHAARAAASAAWAAAAPKIDYAAICDAIEAEKRGK